MVEGTYDFAVIGGGIAGASVGYELAGAGSVVLLEREATLGYHTTGRSAALFTEGHGRPLVNHLAAASRPFLDDPPDGFVDHPILSPRPLLYVGREDQIGSIDRVLSSAGEVGDGLRRVDEAEARTLCPVLLPGYVAQAILEPTAMSIDVHALHHGFISGIRTRGSHVRTGADVHGIERSDDRWVVRAGSEEIKAGVVVNAAGAWADRIGVLAGATPVDLVPMRRTAFTFPAPDGLDITKWPMVVDADEQFYFKPEGPQFLASPEDETPMEPHDARPEEVDVALGIQRIEAATSLRIRTVRSSWAGLRSFVHDRLPVVGMDPDIPGFFWLAGQGGFGILTSPAMARAAAGLLVDGELPADLRARGITAAALAPQRLRT